MSINISNYAKLLEAAGQQLEPQRILFVFTKAELPEDADQEEIARFNEGQGGALTPVMCVDKSLDELSDFSSLIEESKKTEQEWDVVFAACQAGRNGVMPTTEEAQQPMAMMVESIQQGGVARFLAFDREGNTLHIDTPR